MRDTKLLAEIINESFDSPNCDGGLNDSLIYEAVLKAWRNGELGLQPDCLEKPRINRAGLVEKELQAWRDSPSELRDSMRQEQFYRDGSPEMKRSLEQALERKIKCELEQGLDREPEPLLMQWVDQYLKECEATPEYPRRIVSQFGAKYTV
jgi:hypothetical protein